MNEMQKQLEQNRYDEVFTFKKLNCKKKFNSFFSGITIFQILILSSKFADYIFTAKQMSELWYWDVFEYGLDDKGLQSLNYNSKKDYKHITTG